MRTLVTCFLRRIMCFDRFCTVFFMSIPRLNLELYFPVRDENSCGTGVDHTTDWSELDFKMMLVEKREGIFEF